MEIPSNPIFIAGQIAVKSMEKKNSTDAESNLIKKRIEKNHVMMNEFVQTLPEAEKRNQILRDKDKIIEERKIMLGELQQSLLLAKESKLNQQFDNDQNLNQSYEPIPIIVSKLLDLLYKLSESALDHADNSVPLQSLLKVNESIEQLIDLCYQEKFITESEEKNEKRKEENKIIQQTILENLQQIHNMEKEFKEGLYI